MSESKLPLVFDTRNRQWLALTRDYQAALTELRGKFIAAKAKFEAEAKSKYAMPKNFFIEEFFTPESCLHGYHLGEKLGSSV